MYRPTHIAAVAPTVNDDYSGGFRNGNFWINTVSANLYSLTDDTTGAAVWIQVGGSGIYKLQETGVTSDTTFTIPEGYLLQTITAIYNSGSDIKLDFGRSLADDDVGTLRPASGTDNSPAVLTKNIDYSDGGDATLYVDVSGTTPNVDIHIILISNRA